MLSSARAKEGKIRYIMRKKAAGVADLKMQRKNMFWNGLRSWLADSWNLREGVS
jgi:hypothetical protein